MLCLKCSELTHLSSYILEIRGVPLLGVWLMDRVLKPVFRAWKISTALKENIDIRQYEYYTAMPAAYKTDLKNKK